MLFVAAMAAVLQLAVFMAAAPAGAITPTGNDSVYARGTATFYGSPGSGQSSPTVGIAATPTGAGYRTINAGGTVSAFGDATYAGSPFSFGIPSVGIATRPAGGYWTLDRDGGVQAFGGAPNFGSAPLSKPFVAIVATPDSNGYWLFNDVGGVGTVGSAGFYGSVQSVGIPKPNQPIVAAATMPTGNGYWMLTRAGGIFAFGAAQFLGSGNNSGKTFVAIALTPDGNGYWLVADDGTILSFGNATPFAPINAPQQPMAAAAATPQAGGLWVASAGLAPPGAISGTVTSGGTSVAGICVYAIDLTAPALNTTSVVFTTVTGFYKLEGLKGTSYKVSFSDCTNGLYVDQWFNNKANFPTADPVSVTRGATTPNINAALTPAGVITGTVTDEAGAAHKDWCVQVRDTHNTFVTTAHADVSGNYRAPGLAVGSYKVGFADCNVNDSEWIPQWNGGTDNEATAPSVSVAAKTVTSGVDGTLIRGGAISGTIKGSDGLPLANACVSIFDTRPDSSVSPSVTRQTNVSGFYRSPGLRTGSYLVRAVDCATGKNAPQWFRGKTTEAASDPVAVTAGSRTPANLTLKKASSITGVVKDSAGHPVANVCVSATNTDTHSNSLALGWTSVTGYYVITGLAAAPYKVHFNACYSITNTLDSPWWNGKPTSTTADLVTPPSAGARNNVNGVLHPAGSVSGVVRGPSGAVRKNVCVQAYDATAPDLLATVFTSVTGFYRINGLSSGDYKIRFGGCGNVDAFEWFNDKPTWTDADLVHVASGADTTAGAMLAAASTIHGVVSSAAGPLGGVTVELLDSDGVRVDDPVNTSPTGFYRFAGLAAGSYVVHVTMGIQFGLEQFELGLANRSTPVSVPAATSTTQNITVPLAVPGAPTGVNAVAGDGRATVNWTPPGSQGTSPISNYVVTAFDGTTALRSIVVPAPATSAVFTGLTNGTPYRFAVAAMNATATGARSALSAAVTPSLTASISPPAMTTDPMVVTFSDDVLGVTKQNVVIRIQGSSANIAGSLVCRNAVGTTVSCGTGIVRTATLTPTAPLNAAQTYTGMVNPPGVAPVRDFAAHTVTPVSANFQPS